MNVRLDQTAATQETGSIMARYICRDRGLDGGDLTFRDAYINGSVFQSGQAGVRNHEIQHRCHPPASDGCLVRIVYVFAFAKRKHGAAPLDL